MGVTAHIVSNFDIKWFQIAVAHEQAALAARARAAAAPDGSVEMGEAFDAEMKASMVAIAAAAFAIDAMYVKLEDMLDSGARSRASDRVGRIVETLKIALELGPRTQAWQSKIPALFKLRDRLVHFRGEPNETYPHPTGKSNVSLENVTFGAEAATQAVDLALEVLIVAYRSPRKEHSEIGAWAQQASHVPEYLESVRAAGSEPVQVKELRFRMGDVFRSDDPVARFVMACSIALGDLRVAVDYAVRPEQPEHERIYFVRLLISHMREAVKLMVLGHDASKEIRTFVATLPQDARDALEQMRREADPTDENSLFADLKRVRDNAFHYALDREAVELLATTMGSVADYEGVYRLTGDDRMRASYADLIVANAMHPAAEGEDETMKLAHAMQDRMVELVDPVSTFLQAVEGAWLGDNPDVTLHEPAEPPRSTS